MVWDNEKCLELIGLFERKTELWQPDHKYHFNKLKKNDAWEEIATEMGVPSEQLKAKMNSLLASHRRELMKEQTSKGTGKGKDEVYKSKWFGFEALRFIKDKNKCKQTLSSSLFSQNSQVEDLEGVAIGEHSDIEDDHLMNAGDLQESEQVLTSQQRSNVTSPASSSKDERFIRPPAPNKCQKTSPSTAGMSQVDGVVDILQRSAERNASDVYGEHVAMKLKTYNNKTQALVQHYINNIIFRADMGSLQMPAHHQPMLGVYSAPPAPHHYNIQEETSQSYTMLHSPCSNSSSNASSATGLHSVEGCDDRQDTPQATGYGNTLFSTPNAGDFYSQFRP